MTWDTKGEERMRSFKLYRDLEERYKATLAQKAELEARIAQKDNLIRQLAAELHDVVSGRFREAVDEETSVKNGVLAAFRIIGPKEAEEAKLKPYVRRNSDVVVKPTVTPDDKPDQKVFLPPLRSTGNKSPHQTTL